MAWKHFVPAVVALCGKKQNNVYTLFMQYAIFVFIHFMGRFNLIFEKRFYKLFTYGFHGIT